MEPPHTYVQAPSTSVVHHVDYLNRRKDQALCGLALENPAPLAPTIRPVAVCPQCEANLMEYHLKWWRERAETATAELDQLRVKYRELADGVDSQRRQVAGLQHPAQVSGDPADENPDGRQQNGGGPQAASTAEQDETTPASLLGQARKELIELCQPFDEAVPFWRVKKAMEVFSDKLNSDERVRLAQEIGVHGSFIRWCTTEIEGLGWRVTNNPVRGDADEMMEAWTEDLYQPPKKTRRRLGRSRSHDGS